MSINKCRECVKHLIHAEMNSPEDDVSQLTETGNINGRSPPVLSPDDNSALHNDCGKKCSATTDENRTRMNHFNNLTNRSDDPWKVNNNAGPSRMCFRYQNGASSSRSDDCDGSMWNNVDSPNDVEKCPNKVRNGSMDGSGRKKCRRSRCADDDDSSSGNEGEDCCVYTYKGNLQADLPDSFYTLDRLANDVDNHVDEPVRGAMNVEPSRSAAGSSPDNEFLEMDFDPGPSLELDMDESEVDGRVSPIPELPSEQVVENDLSAENQNVEMAEYVNNVSDWGDDAEEPQPGPSSSGRAVAIVPPWNMSALTLPTSNVSQQRNWCARESWGHHCSSGDLLSPWDAPELESGETFTLKNASSPKKDSDGAMDTRKYNMFSDLYHSIMAKRLVMEKNAALTDVPIPDGDDLSQEERETPPVDRTMIWSEQEACNKQVTQISTSACGATAVINVMVALNTPFSLEKVKKGVATRLRLESVALPNYLFSRSDAGATHEDLARGVDTASDGRLFSRFFHMYPERRFSLSKWLSYWMKKGAVPVATLNLQAGLPPRSPIPDAWHHQMIFGVSPRGVFLTNPLECVPEGALLAQLCSPSVLKVKRSDVLQRFTTTTDLTLLLASDDVRWRKLNVLGQIVNMVRESSAGVSQGKVITQHITIPAAYKSGITLVIPKDSPGYEELQAHPELPLFEQ